MYVIHAKKGQIEYSLEEKPAAGKHQVLIRTVCSAISPGTELMIARRPNEQAAALGYSAAGYIEEMNGDCGPLHPGQRVACYGGPYVRHAEWLAVPRNLVVPIPDGVSFEEASFVGLGAIAIHALRKSSLQFGESAAVIGLGIIGQLVAQIANAASYQLAVYDLLEERRRVLQNMLPACRTAVTSQELSESCSELSQGRGVDAVLLCANASDGHLIDLALNLVRERGQVVVVGDMKLDFSRSLMFRKEAGVVVSRAGGPGRGDELYERQGQDYPYAFARWTEGRNMGEFMRLLERRAIQISPLITGEVAFNNVKEAYDRYKNAPDRTLGMVIRYD
ncbi:zinc-dependent alcohol dehydrogenase [Paenibacillus senegalensis]|uniref:zinc-dependent alcohol dehydrogenase n=1 Tax=Paenibacillus senegalensis TaxID=1465766 RepID=UPI0002880141|nr:zinc-binding alcohol dehydrogenase [Paenibacillus senegalensis]